MTRPISREQEQHGSGNAEPAKRPAGPPAERPGPRSTGGVGRAEVGAVEQGDDRERPVEVVVAHDRARRGTDREHEDESRRGRRRARRPATSPATTKRPPAHHGHHDHGREVNTAGSEGRSPLPAMTRRGANRVPARARAPVARRSASSHTAAAASGGPVASSPGGARSAACRTARTRTRRQRPRRRPRIGWRFGRRRTPRAGGEREAQQHREVELRHRAERSQRQRQQWDGDTDDESESRAWSSPAP